MSVASLLQSALLTTLAAAILYLAALTLATVFAAVRAGGRREEPPADEDALAASRFTVPVSVIIPVSGSHPRLTGAVARALALEYPEFEVIVVADRLPPADLTDLERAWQMSPCEYFFRQALPTATVRRIFRSATDPRLILVEKEPTGLVDAMNCGVNLAQYRYVVVLDPAIEFDPEALLRACAPALRDPEQVVAVSTHLERVPAPLTPDGAPMASPAWVTRFERLASLRSLLETRLGLKAGRSRLAARDSVVVWRRDSVIAVGGFAEETDWTVATLLKVIAEPGSERKVVRHGELFGRVCPSALTSMPQASAGRNRAVFRTIASPWGPPAATADPGREGDGAQSASVVPLAASELLPPFVVAWLAVAAPVAAAFGAFPWPDVAFIYLAMSFLRALQSAAALLVRGALPGAPDGHELRRLLAVGPLELVGYSLPLTLNRLRLRRPS
jgi:hypothetical protein